MHRDCDGRGNRIRRLATEQIGNAADHGGRHVRNAVRESPNRGGGSTRGVDTPHGVLGKFLAADIDDLRKECRKRAPEDLELVIAHAAP